MDTNVVKTVFMGTDCRRKYPWCSDTVKCLKTILLSRRVVFMLYSMERNILDKKKISYYSMKIVQSQFLSNNCEFGLKNYSLY